MALTTVANVRMVPLLCNAIMSDGWLQMLVNAADATVKRYAKQYLELHNWTEYHDGNEMPDLVLRQFPVLSGTTTVAAASSGLVLPQATLNVASVSGFNPNGGTVSVQTSNSTYTSVDYTAASGTQFTGCSGGTGTLSSTAGQNQVGSPVVWVDFNGFGGTGPGTNGNPPFPDASIIGQGLSWMPRLDDPTLGRVSRQGVLQRIGGPGGIGWVGYPVYGGYGSQGKLSAYRNPCWSRGQGNIKVTYAAGYADVPDELTYAATALVAGMIRNQPKGMDLQSESLGAYSYSVLSGSQQPEIASVRQILSRYREISW